MDDLCRFELFMKAYSHVSDRIDGVYKDLTRGKASPMGGVAYLSLEDSEVSGWSGPVILLSFRFWTGLTPPIGTLRRRHQVSRYAADETVPGHGTVVWGREDDCGAGSSFCDS
jgi:hypothetical protein